MDLDALPSQQYSDLQPAAILAPQACISCRRQKRKCDKQLPICGLCGRIGRACDYSADIQLSNPSPEEFQALKQEVADLRDLLSRHPSSGRISSSGSRSQHDSTQSDESNSPNAIISPLTQQSSELVRLLGPSSFPPLFFLDSNAFEYERLQIQAPHVPVPPGALGVLGSSQELREMVEQYFATVHSYFPIVSKIRLFQHLANPLHDPGSDIALLFLAMKLASTGIPEGMSAQTQLYQDTKSFYNYVEAQNGFSTQLIQSLLLICLYEIGNAIYPAAYLSAGHAGRLGYAMGIHDRVGSVPEMLPRCLTWTEQEERRRVWWGATVLDRFVNIGHRYKPFATSDPSLNAHLPTDDQAWDRGQMLVATPLALSASPTTQAAPFARTCQASHLLGKVVRHINDRNLPLDYRFEEALQLHRTARSFAKLLPSEAESDRPMLMPVLSSCAGIIYSAIIVLYDAYSCTARVEPNVPETQLEMQKVSIDGMEEISEAVVHLARRVKTSVENVGLGLLSPFVIDSLYQAAACYAWYVRESSNAECGERLAELKDVLTMLDKRWKVAGEYVRIIEATEFALANAVR